MQVVLVYLQPFWRNSLLKCVSQPKIAKNLLKSPISGVQSHSRSSMLTFLKSSLPVLAMISSMSVPICNHFHVHHHHRQPWAQCPLVSDATVTIAAHCCLSRAAWLNSCRVAPHHCSMSSDHSRWGRPLLFEPSIIPNTRVFIFLLSFILQIWPKRRSFLCITFCSRVSANWIFLYNSSLVTFCVHPILRIFR